MDIYVYINTNKLYFVPYKKSIKLILYMYTQYTPCEVKNQVGFVHAKWKARDIPSVSGALVCLWWPHGHFRSGCIYDCGNIHFRTSILSLSGQEPVSSCGVMLRLARINMKCPRNRHRRTNAPETLGIPLAFHLVHTNPTQFFTSYGVYYLYIYNINLMHFL